MSPTPDAPTDPALVRLIDQVRTAQDEVRPVRIRGGGSKDFYGGTLTGELLELEQLRGICSYEPTEMVITARAGTTLRELEEALSEHGQHLCFEPPRFGAGGAQATLGGMVAAGLAGPARAAAGGVRDFVLGACVLNGRGELLRFGGQVVKNVAGYDVARLFVGSMGVLGVICEVSLKVPPLPAASASVELACEEAEALHLMQAWTRAALPVNASAWRAGVMRVRLCGAAAAVRSARERLAKQSGVRTLEPEAAVPYWTALRDQSDAFFSAPGAPAVSLALWRISVPSTTPPLDLPGETLIEWGGAQRWLYSHASPQKIRETAARAGGHASVFRAEPRAPDFLAPISAPLERIHRALKKSFDPAGIFNRGRLYPWM